MATCKELLDRLLTHFYVDSNGELTWNYIEDTSINDVDNVLASDLKDYLEELTQL